MPPISDLPSQGNQYAQKTTDHAVLWDMDGVLVDSSELHYQSWKETLAEFGMLFTRETFKATFGMNNEHLLGVILKEKINKEDIKQISDRKEKNFRRGIQGNIELFPGVLQLLDAIKELGLKQAIASSAPWKNIETLVNELNISGYFQAILSGDNLPSKPDPAVFLKAAELLQVSPTCCVVIEDALHGVEAAHNACMKCIAVATTNPRDKLSSAEIIVDSISEIYPALIFELMGRS